MKAIVIGKTYGKLKNGRLVKFKGLEWEVTLEKVKDPVVICDQYGWKHGCADENFRTIYPPFSATCLNPGSIEELSKWELSCSKVEVL